MMLTLPSFLLQPYVQVLNPSSCGDVDGMPKMRNADDDDDDDADAEVRTPMRYAIVE